MPLLPSPALPFLAFALTLLLHLLAVRFFPRLNLLDFPERYGLSRRRLPYPTGILAPLVFGICYLSVAPRDLQAAGLILSILLLACFCFVDDRRPLPPLLRLIVQAVIALLIFATGTRIYSLTNPFQGMLGGAFLPLDRLTLATPLFGSLPLTSGVFTLVWLGLTVNALNWFDGIPGQVSMLSVIGFFTIGLLSLSARVNQPSLALLAFLLAGIAAGCLLFDFPPPRVVMGDSGAMFFGLMLGVLTIYSGGKVATAFLVLGVPLIDFAIVIVRRLLKGSSILQGNAKDEHLHHRLLHKGWTPRYIIILTATLGALFGITALFLSTLGKFIAAIVLFMVMLGLSWYSKPTKIA